MYKKNIIMNWLDIVNLIINTMARFYLKWYLIVLVTKEVCVYMSILATFVGVVREFWTVQCYLRIANCQCNHKLVKVKSPLMTSVGTKLMKGKTFRKHSLHEKTAASLLSKLFINPLNWLLLLTFAYPFSYAITRLRAW